MAKMPLPGSASPLWKVGTLVPKGSAGSRSGQSVEEQAGWAWAPAAQEEEEERAAARRSAVQRCRNFMSTPSDLLPRQTGEDRGGGRQRACLRSPFAHLILLAPVRGRGGVDSSCKGDRAGPDVRAARDRRDG